MNARTVLAVLPDPVMALNVTGPLEVFAAAGAQAYRITTASLDGRAVATAPGVHLRLVPDADLNACEPPHTLLVPGGPVDSPPDPRLTARLRELADGAERVVGICTGSFLLGATGLLDGRQATTHWAFCDLLADRFPGTVVEPEPLYVRDGRVATSAGVTAGIDLSIALVEEDLGTEAALVVARALVVPRHRSGDQEQFNAGERGRRAERHPLRQVQQWIADNPSGDLSVDNLARRAMLSPRQFARVFRDEVGMTPGRYVDRVRLDAARRRLERSVDGLDEVAQATGYGSAEAMRRAFLRQLSIPPGEYRQRFRSTAAQRPAL
ncbi:GlxA family transcriptional regulator [Yinghuangia seranimata]|uniref:GlxA family transcriptional regulator n=1 Tax=Yinghuangia seranimata TaxID=408067 RepID=UPI00248C38E4|nr:GlxA family transcriptional regulator [Yinghuangia seranimata]MDI2125021.1 GlxA family transcriptional regulator [Yinghuangia seranimata]